MTATFALAEGDYYRLAMESGWPRDCPRGWEAIEAAPRMKRGRGYSRTVTLLTPDACDLADYLWEAAGASAAAAADDGGERGGWQRRLLARVTEAMGDDDPALARGAR